MSTNDPKVTLPKTIQEPTPQDRSRPIDSEDLPKTKTVVFEPLYRLVDGLGHMLRLAEYHPRSYDVRLGLFRKRLDALTSRSTELAGADAFSAWSELLMELKRLEVEFLDETPIGRIVSGGNEIHKTAKDLQNSQLEPITALLSQARVAVESIYGALRQAHRIREVEHNAQLRRRQEDRTAKEIEGLRLAGQHEAAANLEGAAAYDAWMELPESWDVPKGMSFTELEEVVLEDPTVLPDDYLEQKPDLKKIHAALVAGQEIPGARLRRRYSVRIRVRR